MSDIRFKDELENLATLDDLYHLIDSNWDHFFKIDKPISFTKHDLDYSGARFNKMVAEVRIYIDLVGYNHIDIREVFINTLNNGFYFTGRMINTNYAGIRYMYATALIFNKYSPIFSSMMALTMHECE